MTAKLHAADANGWAASGVSSGRARRDHAHGRGHAHDARRRVGSGGKPRDAHVGGFMDVVQLHAEAAPRANYDGAPPRANYNAAPPRTNYDAAPPRAHVLLHDPLLTRLDATKKTAETSRTPSKQWLQS